MTPKKVAIRGTTDLLFESGKGFVGKEGTTPGDSPAAGARRIYPKSDGWYQQDSNGVETKLSVTGHTQSASTITPGTFPNGTYTFGTDGTNIIFGPELSASAEGADVIWKGGAGYTDWHQDINYNTLRYIANIDTSVVQVQFFNYYAGRTLTVYCDGPYTTDTGYQIGGGAATAKYLRGNGTNFVSADLSAADLTGTIDIARIPTGSSSSTVCIGNDARLSDARTPVAHDQAASTITAGTFAGAYASFAFPGSVTLNKINSDGHYGGYLNLKGATGFSDWGMYVYDNNLYYALGTADTTDRIVSYTNWGGGKVSLLSSGYVSGQTGFLHAGGSMAAGRYLRADGTSFISSALLPGDMTAGTFGGAVTAAYTFPGPINLGKLVNDGHYGGAFTFPSPGGSYGNWTVYNYDDNFQYVVNTAGAAQVVYANSGAGTIKIVCPVISATTGFQIAGVAASGKILKGDGTNFVAADLPKQTVRITIDGGGSAIAANSTTWAQVPYSGTIVSWTLLADVSGSITLDVWKDTYTNYPPTVADTITASAKPLISSATKNTSSTLTGWTTTVTAGDVLKFNVDSCTTITKCVLELVIQP